MPPSQARNFRELITGRLPSGKGYEGSPFHRIAKGFIVQGGDVVAGDGTGCCSGLEGNRPFPDESFAIPHSRPGVLSMANSGPDTNGCQFFITFAAVPACDGKHVAFGRLVSGWAVLRRLENLEVDDSDKPFEPVLIARCGELTTEEAARFKGDIDDANGVSGPFDMAGEVSDGSLL